MQPHKQQLKDRNWASRLLFPEFNELQYFLAVSVVVFVWILHYDLIYQHSAYSPDGSLLIFAAVIILTAVTLLRLRLSIAIKMCIYMLYYGVFAFAAVLSLQNLFGSIKLSNPLEILNTTIVMFYLILSITRAVTVYVILQAREKAYMSAITKCFSDVQYRSQAFALTSVFALCAVGASGYLYDDPVVIGVLAYAYASAVLVLTKGLVSYSSATDGPRSKAVS